MICSPCTCWWQFGEHQQTCVPQWVIDLSIFTIRARAATFSDDASFEALEANVWRHRELINQRWRDMVRDPPSFEKSNSTGKLTSLNLADLGL